MINIPNRNTCFYPDEQVLYMYWYLIIFMFSFQANISKFEEQIDRDSIYFRNQSLCETIAGNPVPVLTITSYPHSYDREGLEQFSKYWQLWTRDFQMFTDGEKKINTKGSGITVFQIITPFKFNNNSFRIFDEN